MPEVLIVRVPDIGEFEEVDVVEVLVAAGERVAAGQALIVIESEKASMEVPSPAAGVVEALAVAVGAKVSENDPICTLRAEAAAPAEEPSRATATEPVPSAPSRVTTEPEPIQAELLVLGGGPGGYTAAFRAADLGKSVVLVERYPTLGGVCLNVGCIPSKALLHMAGVIEQAAALAEHGVDFGSPKLDFERIRARKDEVVATLTRGLDRLAQQRQVRVVQGVGRFTDSHELAVVVAGDETRIRFDQAILATGSRNVTLPGLPGDSRVLDSTRALEVEGPPGRLLVVGGGVIGLELATVYLAFGHRVVIVELLGQLLAGADRDLVRPLERRLRERCERVLLETRLASVTAGASGLEVTLEGTGAGRERFDRLLVAVGRRPNSDAIGLETLGVSVDSRGFVTVDAQLRTKLPHVFAIGDLTGPPLLAHRATHQGKVAAEVAAGLTVSFDALAIPSVAYTDPEVAWVGLTEEDARRQGIALRKGAFPWSASGRALGMGRGEGLTKLLFAEQDGRLLGAGLVGAHAGELIGEAALAIELGADAHDLGLTVHPHPTLSETLAFAAEMVTGSITDLLPPRARDGKGKRPGTG